MSPFDAEMLVSLDPSSGQEVWRGPVTTAEQITGILEAGRKAFPSWRDTDLTARKNIIKAFQGELESRKSALADTISRETGKPLWESLTEVKAMIGKIDVSIQAHDQRCGSFVNAGAITRFKPHGLVVVLGPFNFPGHLPNGHIVPAILAGNAVVFKSSEFTPSTGEIMVDCWHKAGLPTGIIQLVQGYQETGKALLESPLIDGVFFTGSEQTGKSLSQQFASQPGKILALELGGNNPLVIHQVRDISSAVSMIQQSAFLTSGQRCTCARRLILVEGSESQDLLTLLVSKTRKLHAGTPFEEPPPFMGPLISEQAVDRVLSFQKQLLSAGGLPLLKARRLKTSPAFLSPGILDVTPLKSRPDAECFGPLLQVIRVSSFEDAIEEANRTRFGLAAGLISDNQDCYAEFFREIRAGIVNWNHPLTGASSAAPFGGIGDSGNHRPSAYFAADYCSYPVASLEQPQLKPPATLPPGSADTKNRG